MYIAVCTLEACRYTFWALVPWLRASQTYIESLSPSPPPPSPKLSVKAIQPTRVSFLRVHGVRAG